MNFLLFTSPANKKHGFSLIELIVVISVILLLSVGVIINYNAYTEKERVRQELLILKSNLRLAHTKAISGQKPTGCDKDNVLEYYEVTFYNICPSDSVNSCYMTVPVCLNGRIESQSETVYLSKNVQFGSVCPGIDCPTIRFFPLTAGTDLKKDQIITLQSSSATYPYHVVITPSGTVSDY